MQNNNHKIVFQREQPNAEQFLYKYVTIEKLIDFIINRRIPLTRLDLFEDKLEGITTTHALLNLGGNKLSKDFFPSLGNTFKYITVNAFPKQRNSYAQQKETFQKTNFSSCWHASKHESIAMWQIYSNPNSVAIKIPYKVLKEEIESNRFQFNVNIIKNIKVGAVNYHHFEDLEDVSEAILKEDIIGFLKDKSFQHENEFRIIAEIEDLQMEEVDRNDMMLNEQVNELNSGRRRKVIYMKLECFEKMNFEILFHPQSAQWHRENIIKLLKSASLDFKCFESYLKENFR